MPNWCYNMEVIAGPKEQVKPLYDNLTKWIKDDIVKNDFSNGWLGNIVGHSGIEEDSKNPGTWKHHCRGELVDDFKYEENEKGEGVILFATETAWGPFPDMWDAVLEKCAPDASYYYLAEEPNMCIFESNDTEHRFFDEEFCISCGFWEKHKLPDIYAEEFANTEDGMLWDWDRDEVIGMMERITGMDIDYDNDEELDKLMKAFEEKTQEDLDGDNYINVYKVEYVN